MVAVDPVAAIGHAVDDMVVAGIDHLTRNEIGHEQMFWAGAKLSSAVEWPVEARAVPATLNRRCVQAGSAGDGSCGILMADGMVVAETAFPPGGIVRDSHRRALGLDNPAGFFD